MPKVFRPDTDVDITNSQGRYSDTVPGVRVKGGGGVLAIVKSKDGGGYSLTHIPSGTSLGVGPITELEALARQVWTAIPPEIVPVWRTEKDTDKIRAVTPSHVLKLIARYQRLTLGGSNAKSNQTVKQTKA